MNKILAFLIVFLISVSTVLAGDLSVINVVNPAQGNPGASVTGSFNVKNTNTATAYNSIVFVKSDLTNNVDPTSKILSSSISFNPATIATLNANEVSSLIVSTVAIPSVSKPGTYTGNIEVRDGTGTQSAIFPLTVVVNTVPQISIETFSTTSPLTISEEQGSVATGTFVIKNNGNVVLSNLDINHNVVLTDNDNDTITLSFTGLPSSLAVGSSATVTVKAAISNNADFGTYSGTVNVKDLVQNVQTSFVLNILVQPRVCSDGVRSNDVAGGDNLRLTIKEPRTSTKVVPAQDLDLKINVRNNGNRDNDVVVDAFIFDLDNNDIIVEAETEVILVENGKSEDFELTLKVPADVDVRDKFGLFVKAYEQDDESKNCGEINQDMTIRRDKHSVTQNKIVLTPSILSCSDTFDVAIDVLNIGTTKESDVTLRLFDDELKIDLSSNPVILEKFDTNDDKATVRFRDIKIPANAQEKQYQIETLLSYDNGQKTESKFGTVTVRGCTAIPSANGENRKVSVQTLVSSFTVHGGDSISIPVTVSNSDNVQTQYVVELQNAQDFTDSAPLPKTLILNPGQSETVYFNLITKSSLNTGKYTGTVVVRSGSNVLDTKAVTITAEKSSAFNFGLGNVNVNKAFWIAADLILIIVAIFFIKLIFGRKKKTPE